MHTRSSAHSHTPATPPTSTAATAWVQVYTGVKAVTFNNGKLSVLRSVLMGSMIALTNIEVYTQGAHARTADFVVARMRGR